MNNDSLTEFLESVNIENRKKGEHHHTSEGWVNIDCPHCSPDSRHFRLGINLTTWIANCYVCGVHNLASTIALTLNRPRFEVVRLLGEYTKDRTKVKDDIQMERKRLVLPKRLTDLLPPHRKYLKSRGFDPDKLVKLWGIRGIGVCPQYGWRIWIPIHLHDKIVSWTTRSISDKIKLRYLTAKPEYELTPLKSLLYGEQYCQHAIIVNEGPVDVWTFGPGAVATCGVGYTKAQLLRMSKYPIRVVCFDNEPEAQKRARKLVRDLSVYDGETYNVQLSGKDANKSPEREIYEIRKRFLF